MTYFDSARYARSQAGRIDRQQTRTKLNKLFLEERKQKWRTQQVVAVLYIGDEATDEIKLMTEVERLSWNKRFRRNFIRELETDDTVRMKEWRIRAGRRHRTYRQRNRP